MARFGEKVLDELEKVVEGFEADTTVELVLVLSRRSERYLDVPFKTGTLLAFLTLVALIYLPVDFSPDLLLVDTVAAFVVGYLIGWTSPFMSRWLTSSRRKQHAVRRAAQAAFTSQGVSLTRERTGLLLYVSWLERKVELIADVGIENGVPKAPWQLARRKLYAANIFKNFPGSLTDSLAPLHQALCEHMPCREDNPDEIPNRPVVMK